MAIEKFLGYEMDDEHGCIKRVEYLESSDLLKILPKCEHVALKSLDLPLADACQRIRDAIGPA